MLDRNKHVSLEQQKIYPNRHSVMGEKESIFKHKNKVAIDKKKKKTKEKILKQSQIIQNTLIAHSLHFTGTSLLSNST